MVALSLCVSSCLVAERGFLLLQAVVRDAQILQRAREDYLKKHGARVGSLWILDHERVLHEQRSQVDRIHRT